MVWLPHLEFFMYTQLLMHAFACIGSMNTVRESALKVDWEKNTPMPHQGLKPVSAGHQI